MASNPFRSRLVPDSVQKEFKKRSDDKSLIEWVGQRFPWIYALSCAEISDVGCSGKYNELGLDPTASTAGQSKNLFGTNVSLATYDSETLLPLPHIESMDVKALGGLGTTRKATVKIKAYSDEQLINLQKCFFIPGMDVRIQWGWNKDCQGNPPPPLLDNKKEKASVVICKINKMRKKYANYDGFQGVVGNFKYSLAKDNSWDCEMEILSAADPFTSSKVDNSGCPCAREVETDDGEHVKDFGPIYSALADIYSDGGSAAKRLKRTLRRRVSDTQYHAWAVWEMDAVERTEDGGEKDGSWYDGLIFGGEETTEYWISFGMFIDMLNVMSVPSLEEDKTWPYGKVSLDGIMLPKPKFCASGDPRVCYIDGGNLPMSDLTGAGIGDALSMLNPFNIIGAVADAADAAGSQDTWNAVGRDPSTGQEGVILGNIMCNVIFLLKEYKSVYNGDGKLKTLVDNVLRGINNVCGNPWNFVTIATEQDCGDPNSEKVPPGPTITILDEKAGMRYNEPYFIPSKVGNSTLRDFGLSMKMTGAMKTQALYAGNNQTSKGGDGKDGTGCTGTAVAPFYIGRNVKNLAKPAPSTAKVDCNDCEKGEKHADPPTFEDLKDDMESEINDQTAGAMTEYIRKKVANQTDPKYCAGVPLPFDFNFKVDGIGGFEFGQLVSSDRVPKEIRNEFRWQVTKVEHSIKPNDWETSINTVARSNPYGTDPQPFRSTT